MTERWPAPGEYAARWGYRHIDAARYERRRYGGLVRGLALRLQLRALRRALAGVPRGGLVLDAPGGTGILHEFLRAEGFRVVAVDISTAMLAVARRRGLALGHVCGDLERPPLRDRSVDAIVCTRFLMHLAPEDRVDVLRTLSRLTRGPIVATYCHPYTWKSLGRAVRRRLGLRVKASPRVTRREITSEVAASGLRLGRLLAVAPGFSEIWVATLVGSPEPQGEAR